MPGMDPSPPMAERLTGRYYHDTYVDYWLLCHRQGYAFIQSGCGKARRDCVCPKAILLSVLEHFVLGLAKLPEYIVMPEILARHAEGEEGISPSELSPLHAKVPGLCNNS